MVAYRIILVLGFVSMAASLSEPNIPQQEKDPSFWKSMAKNSIKMRLRQTENNEVALNVILFIGDGMGVSTVTAARILRGQINNRPGEETVLAFEEFPNVALSKTYNVDRQTPDSAGTATAMLSGVKTNYNQVGLNAQAILRNCTASKGKEVETMIDWAIQAGKGTGIVTTSRITHGTPAAAYAHAAYRYWEGDVDTAEIEGDCDDIAKQLIDDNRDIKVILGGGRRYFLPQNTLDPETNSSDSNQRLDGRSLVQEWADDKARQNLEHKYVWNKEQFDAADSKYVDYLLGLFEPSDMQYELDRDTSANGEPSLAEMTRKAIQILQKEHNGFFLLVEGARIDHAHHENLAKKALYETLAFEDAIREAVTLTSSADTLIIVTADHSHVFSIAGYPYRGTDIFGLVEPVSPSRDTTDGKPYSVLHYGNGPGYNQPRQNLSNVDMGDKSFAFPSGVPMPRESHGGEDVAIYARGPMSHLFHGVHEQNYIAHVMAYSACIGPYFGDCERRTATLCTGVASRPYPSSTLHIILLSLITFALVTK